MTLVTCVILSARSLNPVVTAVPHDSIFDEFQVSLLRHILVATAPVGPLGQV